MPGYGQQKRWYELVENFDVFIFIRKIKFVSYLLLEILLRYGRLVILGTVGMPHHPH